MGRHALQGDRVYYGSLLCISVVCVLKVEAKIRLLSLLHIWLFSVNVFFSSPATLFARNNGMFTEVADVLVTSDCLSEDIDVSLVRKIKWCHTQQTTTACRVVFWILTNAVPSKANAVEKAGESVHSVLNYNDWACAKVTWVSKYTSEILSYQLLHHIIVPRPYTIWHCREVRPLKTTRALLHLELTLVSLFFAPPKAAR